MILLNQISHSVRKWLTFLRRLKVYKSNAIEKLDGNFRTLCIIVQEEQDHSNNIRDLDYANDLDCYQQDQLAYNQDLNQEINYQDYNACNNNNLVQSSIDNVENLQNIQQNEDLEMENALADLLNENDAEHECLDAHLCVDIDVSCSDNHYDFGDEDENNSGNSDNYNCDNNYGNNNLCDQFDLEFNSYMENMLDQLEDMIENFGEFDLDTIEEMINEEIEGDFGVDGNNIFGDNTNLENIEEIDDFCDE